MRLTIEIRRTIINAVMHKAFDARDKAHEKATTALADAVYQHEYGAVAKIVAKLPENWCSRDNYIAINAAGFHWRESAGLKNERLRMSKTRPKPEYRSGGEGIKIGGDHPLNDQAQAVAEEYQQIQRDKEELRVKLNALVSSVTTTEKLLEAWPECEQFIPSGVPISRALVPVELVPQLNAAIGLQDNSKPAPKAPVKRTRKPAAAK